MISFKHGNLLSCPVDFLVNTVNCNGVMGKGIALAFRRKFPQMFSDYKSDCDRKVYQPGTVRLYKTPRSIDDDTRITIANAATKGNWWEPSQYEYVATCLDNLHSILSESVYEDVAVAIPPLGCGNGGLDWSIVKEMIEERMSDLPQWIYVFNPVEDQRNVRHGL